MELSLLFKGIVLSLLFKELSIWNCPYHSRNEAYGIVLTIQRIKGIVLSLLFKELSV